MVGKPNFNPRPREEGDVSDTPNDVAPSISIHALVKRATMYNYSNCVYYHFNPRPREEGDQLTSTLKALRTISIHALVKRATVDNSL